MVDKDSIFYLNPSSPSGLSDAKLFLSPMIHNQEVQAGVTIQESKLQGRVKGRKLLLGLEWRPMREN